MTGAFDLTKSKITKSKRRRAFAKRRRLFLFAAQKGVCCLQISGKCKEAGGAMQIVDPSRRDFATFEHLLPRSKAEKSKRDLHETVLLACSRCNNKKGARIADAELMDWGRRLWVELQRQITAEALARQRIEEAHAKAAPAFRISA